MATIVGHKTLAEITREVAEEWRRAGKELSLPPDDSAPGDEREVEFWDEVQSRFDEQPSA